MILLILSFLILLIPAYLATRIFFKTKLLTAIAISIGFTITLSIISGFLLNLSRISALTLWLFYLILIAILSAIVYTKKIRLFPKIEIGKNKSVILLIILILSSIIVYTSRHDYLFPNHLDEWNHISFTGKIIKTGHLFNSPYGDFKEYHLETGTHIFLTELFLLIHTDPLTNYRFLPAIFIFLTSFILFVSIYSLTKKFWASTLPIFFLAALKSNANFLGTWLFTPFSMAFPFIFLFLFLFSKGVADDKKEYFISSIILLLTMVLFHASTAIIMGIIAVIYLFFNISYLKKHYIALSSSLVVLILAGLLFFKFTLKKGIAETISIILNYKFPLGITYTYNYIIVYGIVASILTFLGLLIVLKSKKLRIYALFWIVMLIYYLISYLIPYTLYIEYLRIFYLLMLSSVVLSGFGACYLLNFLSRLFKQKYLKTATVIIILLALFLLQFSHYYKADLEDTRELRTQWHKYINEDDYKALLWFQKNDIKNKRIFSLPRIGNAIPLTGNYPSARIRLLHGFPEEVIDSNRFFKENDCDKRKAIIDKYNPDYAVSRAEIKCNFLKLEYSNKDYIYSIVKIA